MKLKKLLFWMGILFLATTSCHADVTLPALFSDHMILQQGMPLPVWGWAESGEKVSVQLAEQKLEAVAGTDGKWKVEFAAMKAQGEPVSFVISGRNRIELKDVLVGEVWICSGQSNMERQLGPRSGQQLIDNWEAERDAANYPQIRQFLVGGAKAVLPADRIKGSWTVCSPQTVPNFSAVGYFFARDLYEKLRIPVGIVHSSAGGTAIEPWLRRETVADESVLRQKLEVSDKNLQDYETELPEFQKNGSQRMEQWRAAVLAAKAAGQAAPPNPDPGRFLGNQTFGVLHNAMITPLVPYAIRGVLWYQGESNSGDAANYRLLLELMIADWRKEWGGREFPFLFVQVAPFKGTRPELREAQLEAWKGTRNTAMVVITDCGNSEDIHPSGKRPVGERLALAARVLAYGEKIEYSGPVYESVKRFGKKIVLTFSHLGGGLISREGALKGFEVSEDGLKFVAAQAEIVGDTVELGSEAVGSPKFVRYGWANAPEINLFNKEGLPASPFRAVVE